MPIERSSAGKESLPRIWSGLDGLIATRGLYQAIKDAKQIEDSAAKALEFTPNKFEAPPGHHFSIKTLRETIRTGEYRKPGEWSHAVEPGGVSPGRDMEIDNAKYEFFAEKIIAIYGGLYAVAADGQVMDFDPVKDFVNYVPLPETDEQ